MFHLIVIVYEFITAIVTKVFYNEYHYTVLFQDFFERFEVAIFVLKEAMGKMEKLV